MNWWQSMLLQVVVMVVKQMLGSRRWGEIVSAVSTAEGMHFIDDVDQGEAKRKKASEIASYRTGLPKPLVNLAVEAAVAKNKAKENGRD